MSNLFCPEPEYLPVSSKMFICVDNVFLRVYEENVMLFISDWWQKVFSADIQEGDPVMI